MNIDAGYRWWFLTWVLCSINSVQAETLSPADQEEGPIETVHVIGVPGDHATAPVPVDAIVIERKMIETYGSASLATVLQQVPGISINQNAGRGSFNSLFLRGADPNFTQVRIDGVVVNDATNTRGGAFDISSINAQIIERIEIITDASTAVYGSQALAGIINIVTRESSLQGALELDSHGGETASLFFAADGLALSFVHERPQSIIPSSLYRSDEIGAKASWRWQDDHRLQLIGRLQSYDTMAFPDDSGGQEFATNRDLEVREGDVVQLAAHYHYPTASGNYIEINASLFRQEEQRDTPAVAPGLRDPFGLPRVVADTDYLRNLIEAHYTHQFRENLQARTVLGWEQERGRQIGELDLSFVQLPTDFDLKRHTLSLSQSLTWQPADGTHLVISARIDSVEGDAAFSPKVSVSHLFANHRQTVFASAGKGYKQASIYALADPLIGSETLLDETAYSLQAGHEYRGADWSIKHTIFFYDFSHLIDFEAGPPPSLVNRDSVQVRGIESLFFWEPDSQWQLDVFQTFTDTDVSGVGNTLRMRPRFRAGARLQFRASPALNMWIRSRYTAKRLDSSIPTGDVMLDGYSVTDVGAQWSFSEYWQLTAQWNNLLSENYYGSIGNPVTGSTVTLQLAFLGAD